MRFLRLLIGISVALSVAACGGGSLTLTEYAAEVEQLVAEMENGFASADAEWESQAPSVAGAEEYWEDRLEVRYDFLEGVEALEPPEEVADMHQESLDLFTKMTDADEALAARSAEFDEFTDHWQWVDTPEGQASDKVLAEVFEFCRASQEDFDATQEREQFAVDEWLPSEMKEVVRVAFGCPE